MLKVISVRKLDQGRVDFSHWEENIFGPDGNHYRTFKSRAQEVGAVTLESAISAYKGSARHNSRNSILGASVVQRSYAVVGPLRIPVPFTGELVDETSFTR